MIKNTVFSASAAGLKNKKKFNNALSNQVQKKFFNITIVSNFNINCQKLKLLKDSV